MSCFDFVWKDIVWSGYVSEYEAHDWNQIVQTHSRRVFSVAMRILGSVPDAEDVCQEVFLAAYRFQLANPVQSWVGLLVRLATLRSLNASRRKRPTEMLNDQDAQFSSDPASDMIRKELAQMLRTAIGKLPDQQATVFVMSHYEQMPREEIASCLGVSPESVSSALYKARQRLSEELPLSRQEND